MELRDMWEKPSADSTQKSVCDVYGAEHLARLIGMPPLTPTPSMVLTS